MAEIKKLLKGYHDFHETYFQTDGTLYSNLVEKGQSPKTLVIACSDSRVDPSIIMNAEPGDIFVIRNVANLVPPYQIQETGLHGVSAALEFAVRILEVSNVIVLGHEKCAGIQSLFDTKVSEQTDFIGKWMEVAKPACEKAKLIAKADDAEDLLHCCEKEGIILSMKNLMTFPWIRDRVEKNTLKLHGWYFFLKDGVLESYVADKKRFVKL